MNLQEKTLAELAQGATGFATLRVGEAWRRGLVFENGEEKFFGFWPRSEIAGKPTGFPYFTICRYRIINNGVKVGSEVLAIPATELKALLSVVEGE